MRKLFFLLFLGLSISLQTMAQKAFVLGEVKEIQSLELDEKRTINIYLPEASVIQVNIPLFIS